MKEKPYRYWIYIAARCAIAIIGFLPRRVAHLLAWVVSLLVYSVLVKERKKVIAHLTYAFHDEYSSREIHRIAFRVFRNVCIMAADLMKLYHGDVNTVHEFVDADPAAYDAYRNVVSERNGFIVAASHLGNWELLAAYLTDIRPIETDVCVVGKKIYYDKYNELIVNFRKRFNVLTIYRDTSFKTIVKALKQGGGVGILSDQDVDSIPGIFVNFFNKPAYTTDSIARLSLMTGAPIFPCAVVREGLKYRFIVGEVIVANREADKDAELDRVTQAVSAEIEKMIRRYPDQWVWMHNRWKTQPAPARDQG